MQIIFKLKKYSNTYKIFKFQIRSLNGSSDLLPVMVWLTGGGFVDGLGSYYGGKYFMDQLVILVTVNFRLGAFGTLPVYKFTENFVKYRPFTANKMTV